MFNCRNTQKGPIKLSPKVCLSKPCQMLIYNEQAKRYELIKFSASVSNLMKGKKLVRGNCFYGNLTILLIKCLIYFS
jgi:hypothetical protein